VTSTQLRDDLLSMLVAGHETTASVLTWTMYLLVKNPDKMAKAQVGDGPRLEIWLGHGAALGSALLLVALLGAWAMASASAGRLAPGKRLAQGGCAPPH
jgi:hypothetical protein